MSALVAQLQGASDEEIVRVLQKKMLTSGNAEATEFLRSIPSERADAIRWKLVESLENIGKKKQAAGGGKAASSPAQPPAAAAAAAAPRQAAAAALAVPAGTGGQSVSPGLERRSGGAGRAGPAVPGGLVAASKAHSASPLSKSAGEEGEEKKERATRGAAVGGRYQLGELLGKGGFARVFKALDLQTGQQLAVKEIQKDLLSKTELPKILNEGKVLSELSHTNIVKFVELVVERQKVYFVMEYISGGSLYHTMKRFGVFPESLICVYVAQTLLALEYLHSQHVLHRDIKGANLLLDANGRIKVADFGACTYAELDKRLTVIGTPFWMAPEIIEMTSGGTAADIWSLGCTVIELLTGSPPYYTLGSMQALFRMVDDPHPPLPANVSPGCRDFLLKCFVKDFSKRPTATQLLGHEWIRAGVSGRNTTGISPDQMQLTLRVHNQTRKTVAGMDWGARAPDDAEVLEKQARQLQAAGNDEDALLARLARKEKEKERMRRQLDDSREVLAALRRDVLALTAERSKLELQRIK